LPWRKIGKDMAFNVLILDDSPSMRQIIKRTISISGFDIGTVFEGSDGQEGLEVLDREWVDVILTDLNMPGMDGTTFLKALREDPLKATVPVVIVSTEGREERVKALFSIGVHAYIKKPFKPELIRNTLMEVLGMDGITRQDPGGPEGCDF